MKKLLMILIFASCLLKITAQHSINDYKYVIVEKQFHFQSEPNKYNLNELTRFLLKKNGALNFFFCLYIKFIYSINEARFRQY